MKGALLYTNKIFFPCILTGNNWELCKTHIQKCSKNCGRTYIFRDGKKDYHSTEKIKAQGEEEDLIAYDARICRR